uniref:Triosephosphate isomerase n=1 Tax=Chromera velia CCMP2878 TaxID=1169474 RepID=A0A0G4FLB0_9ALVE|mmetsp:Transcript_44312/g.87472  ORF Transcript_44312/g.87472 Transcript_44312/m.87472 type:complete len:252 (+) Transcript_44312:103-858(+)|eukprot:Cvel_17569.t1-p1 / transcript=Cvel_17569.t1 / gene=Cvel_17569 / organism=Chromera_velia_CCMP2878 / gene_product=Triosephosphate isomerase, putative / transcript_product=Triosephosphate isomerase, putative / location=Cvel_scaffold1411:42017-42769(+) / protein_length=251 / sequence_SO=supercontig / SO=protein_coding / is_pseudo=false
MAPRKPWVGGNFKCNGTKSFLETHAEALNKAEWDPAAVDVVLCPVAMHIPLCMDKFKKDFIICTQNVSKTGNGAYTGEISVDMIKDMGLSWTLIGHSERRSYYGETDEVVADKVEACQKGGINAAVCIGEVLEEREGGKTEEVVKKQVEAFIPKVTDWSKIVIAYEPVWAIGTGKVATPEQAQDTHACIRKLIKEKCGDAVAAAVRIVYGGSVSDSNCVGLFANEDIDGFLVGGASLKPAFIPVIDSAKAK